MSKYGRFEGCCSVAKITVLFGWDMRRDECFSLRQGAVMAAFAAARDALMTKRGGFEGDRGVAHYAVARGRNVLG